MDGGFKCTNKKINILKLHAYIPFNIIFWHIIHSQEHLRMANWIFLDLIILGRFIWDLVEFLIHFNAKNVVNSINFEIKNFFKIFKTLNFHSICHPLLMPIRFNMSIRKILQKHVKISVCTWINRRSINTTHLLP